MAEATTKEDHELLHLIYCDNIGNKNAPFPIQHVEQHGMKYVFDHLDADELYICRDFCKNLSRCLGKKTSTDKEFLEETNNQDESA